MRRILGPLLVIGTTLAVSDAGSAEPPNDDPVVATIGDVQIGAGELESRIAAMTPFQRRTFGRTPEEIRKGVLEKEMIPEVLFSSEARLRKYHERAGVAHKLDQTLSRALRDHFRAEAEAKLTREDVRRFFLESQAGKGPDGGAPTEQQFEGIERSYRITLRRRTAAKRLETLRKDLLGKQVRDHRPEQLKLVRMTREGVLLPATSSATKEQGAQAK